MQNAAREAVTLSRAARTVQRRPVELAPAKPVTGTWMTPVQRDPIDVPLEEKIALLLGANEAALRVKNVRFVSSGFQLLREVKTLVTSEGTNVTQTFIRVGPSFSATAIATGDFQTYEEELAPRGQGWEYVESLNMPRQRRTLGVDRRRKAHREERRGRSVRSDSRSDEPVADDSRIDRPSRPSSIARSGQEANYAGTSFVAPPEKMIGKLKYGPEFMNVQADRTQAGSLSRVAWDDEGVPADQWLIIDKGIFKDYQTTREQAKWIQHLTGVQRSHGCSFAESWNAVQFQRMPNISLLPGERDISLDDIVAATDRGIVIKNRGSWSIDNQRYNFQFSGQSYHEVRNGKIVGMLRDVAYQSNTPVFWNSMDMIGGKSSYWLGGSFNDGKGEPARSSSVSHGCPPCRFRNVTILNTGQKS